MITKYFFENAREMLVALLNGDKLTKATWIAGDYVHMKDAQIVDSDGDPATIDFSAPDSFYLYNGPEMPSNEED